MSTPNAETLRQQWKSVMTSQEMPEGSDSAIRMHRVCKWLGQGQTLYGEDRPDLAFITCWIAWNALYCSWGDDGQPEKDFAGMRTCLGQVLHLDQHGYLEGWIYRERERITAVLTDPFLSRHFWGAVGKEAGEVELSDYADARSVGKRFDRREWPRLLEDLFGRLYVLRNQLIHGGATPGSSRNRDQIARGRVLEGFLIAALQAICESDNPWHDWGKLPYPVLDVD